MNEENNFLNDEYSEDSSELARLENEELEEIKLLDAENEAEQSPESEPSSAKEQPKEFEIVGVRFKKNGKIYYFAPMGFELSLDMHVIVETARGTEFGFVGIPNKVVPAKEVVLPLRSVIRIATKEDEDRYSSNLEKATEAFNVCLDKIELHKLDMKLVDVEYTFDNSKLLFYFTAEGRIDFRDLVKDLASIFRTRIELRQIGIRDEAKLMGGLGVCGRPFCCSSFLDDFVQVSIKMAKEQNLSLNSSKISGACGRLMCCLRYEHDTYAEEIAKTPKVDALVATPDGDGTVIETTPLAGMIKVRLDDAPEQPPRIYHRDDVTLIKSKRTREEIQAAVEKSKEAKVKPETLDAPKENGKRQRSRTKPRPAQKPAPKAADAKTDTSSDKNTATESKPKEKKNDKNHKRYRGKRDRNNKNKQNNANRDKK